MRMGNIPFYWSPLLIFLLMLTVFVHGPMVPTVSLTAHGQTLTKAWAEFQWNDPPVTSDNYSIQFNLMGSEWLQVVLYTEGSHIDATVQLWGGCIQSYAKQTFEPCGLIGAISGRTPLTRSVIESGLPVWFGFDDYGSESVVWIHAGEFGMTINVPDSVNPRIANLVIVGDGGGRSATFLSASASIHFGSSVDSILTRGTSVSTPQTSWVDATGETSNLCQYVVNPLSVAVEPC